MSGRRQLKRIIILLMVMTPIAVAALLYGFYKTSIINKGSDHGIGGTVGGMVHVVAKPPGDIAFPEKKPMNILVLGLDVDWDDVKHAQSSDNSRSDTMFVLSVAPDGKRIGMLSIPRDFWVEMPTGGMDRINSAYGLGKTDDQKVHYAEQVVEKLTGTHIDKFVVVKIELAKELIDALGGITLNVEKNMDYDDNWGLLHVHLKKGLQHLNGEQAIGYARFRHDEEGDRGRIRRQQQFVNALIKELKNPANYDTPGKLAHIAHIFRTYLSTDISLPEMVDLARVYKDFKRQNLRTGHLEGDDIVVDGAQVIRPEDPKVIEREVATVLGGVEPKSPEDLSVEVYNGSPVKGAATAYSDELRKEGVQIARVEDYPGKTPPPQSLAVVHGDESLVTLVTQWLPGVKVVADTDYPDAGQLKQELQTDDTTQVTVILGQDWKKNPALQNAAVQ
ncbi:MAG: LCP family protein [Candidatus Xenobia bacterium]